MLLSIITINYNNKSGLEKTIPSVLTQRGISPENLEYIIIDGGSTDGSVDIIKKYADDSTYPQKISKWITEKDNGIYNAINKGIKLASGDIIGLVNSGDTVIPGAYDTILELHKEHPESILYGAVSFYKNGIFECVHGPCAEQLPIRMIAHPASFVPKMIYEKYGTYDETFRSSGDWDLFLSFYQAGVSFHYINKLIINFDIDGISNTNTKLVIKENNRILENHNLKKVEIKPVIIKILHFILPGFFFWIFKLLKKILKHKS